jgi:hypothetical protein
MAQTGEQPLAPDEPPPRRWRNVVRRRRPRQPARIDDRNS